MLLHRPHGLALVLDGQCFRLSATFSAPLSRRDSANRFLSLAFSFSTAFNRRASETSIPPNFLRQVYKVASEMLYLRHNSFTARPASAFRMLMICSPENRFFMLIILCCDEH